MEKTPFMSPTMTSILGKNNLNPEVVVASVLEWSIEELDILWYSKMVLLWDETNLSSGLH